MRKVSKSTLLYAEKLKKKGYTVRFNNSDACGRYYESVSVCGKVFLGRESKFSTPRNAYDYVIWQENKQKQQV